MKDSEVTCKSSVLQQRLAEQALRESDERYRDLFENANDALATFTLDGTITSVNRGAERLLGWSRTEVIGQPFHKFATPASVALAEERTRRFLAGEKLPSSVFEAELVRKDGSIVPVEARTRAIRDRDRKVIGFQGSYRDIAERQRVEQALRESEERYRNLFENANDAIAAFTLDGVFTSVNRGMERLLGRSRAELIGQPARRFATPAVVALAEERARRFLAGEKLPPTLEAEVVRKDGSIVSVDVRTGLIRDRHGKPIGIQGIVRDITERKQAEEALREQARVARGQTVVLARTLNALSAEPTLDTFLGQVLTAIAQQLQAQWVTLALYDTLQDTLSLHMRYDCGKILSAAQLSDPAVSNPPRAHDVPLWRELVRTRRLLVVEDVEHDPRIFYRESLVAQGVKTVLLVPLVVAEEVVGLLSLHNTDPHCYRPEELELAQVLSHQVTLAMQLTHLAEQARQAAVLEERNRIAREIHDTLAQGFTGIVLHLEAAKHVLTAAPEKAQTRLDEACALARESLAEARRSVMALRPQVLEYDDLPIVLARLATLATGSPADIAFHVHGTVRSLPAEIETNLLRISQEALANACTHAQARKIQIDLTFGVHEVQLCVQDDGRGFDVHGSAASKGFGLTSMRERAERIGGQYSLTSRPGQGTEVVVVIPNSHLKSFGKHP